MGTWQRRQLSVVWNAYLARGLIMDTFDIKQKMLQDLIAEWGRFMNAHYKSVGYKTVMLSLTYKKNIQWVPGDINNYLRKLKLKMGNKLLGYAWVSELHKDNRVHFHICVFAVKKCSVPYPDKSGMWKKGMSNYKPNVSYGYLTQYVGKAYQKNYSLFPKGMRTYGIAILNKEYKEIFKELVTKKRSENNEWVYVGSAVTYDYAQGLLDGIKISEARFEGIDSRRLSKAETQEVVNKGKRGKKQE